MSDHLRRQRKESCECRSSISEDESGLHEKVLVVMNQGEHDALRGGIESDAMGGVEVITKAGQSEF